MCPPTVFGLMKSCSAIWSGSGPARGDARTPLSRTVREAPDRLRPRAPREAQTAARCVGEGPRGPREQLIVVERFHDVVVGADEEPGNPVRGRRPLARDEDDSTSEP